MGFVANFKTEKPHHGTAFQWFDQGEILAYLPLPGQQMSMVWSVPPARAKALVEASSEALESAVAKAGHHMLGSLQCVGPAREFPLNLMKVASPIASRTILIGDAAHGIHPLSGHGVNLGFKTQLHWLKYSVSDQIGWTLAAIQFYDATHACVQKNPLLCNTLRIVFTVFCFYPKQGFKIGA